MFKKLISMLIFLLASLSVFTPAVQAQISGSTAYRVVSGTSIPATCNPGPGVTDIYIVTSGSPGVYWCSATDTWTVLGGGGGGGTPGGANGNVQINNSGVFGGVAGISSDKISKLTLGVAGTSVGGVQFFNATSGSVTIQPVTGALGTVTLSLPATTGTLTALGNTTTGSGSIVLATSPTLVTPALGTPSSATLTNATGLPVSTGISGLGTGVATALANAVNGASGIVVTGSSNQISETLSANNVTGLLIKRNTDISPTGNYFDFQNAAGTTVAKLDIAGALTVTSCTGCGGSSGITIGTTTITSGTNTRVLFNNSGVVGEYAITGTGNVAMSASPTFTGTVAGAAFTASGTIVQTSASATAFESGPNGSTNPVFRLVNNTASSATGLSITGNAAGSGVTLTALSSGTTENILVQAKGGTGVTELRNSNAATITATTTGTALITRSGAVTNSTSAGLGNVALQINNTSTSVGSQTLTNVGLGVAASGADANIGIYVNPGSGAGIVIGSSLPTTPAAAAMHSTSTATRQFLFNRTDIGTAATDGTYMSVGSNGDFNIINQETASTAYIRLLANNGTGAALVLQQGGAVAVESTQQIGFLPGSTHTASIDAILRRAAAANIAHGAADAAAPVAQTISVQNVVAGTSNTAGANFTIAGSQGTGTGAGGSIIFQTAPAGSSGTAQNALVTALTINSAGQSLFASGTAAAPGIAWGTETNTGIYRAASGYIYFTVAGTAVGGFGAGQFDVIPSGTGGIRIYESTGTNFSIIRNAGTSGSTRFGAADAASPVAQKLSTQGSRGGTDTNISGANLSLVSGLGTGNATPSSLLLRGPAIGSSGSTQQTEVTGLAILNGAAVLSNYTVATLPSASVCGAGALAFVTDATLTAITGLGLAPTGGGSNKVIVYSDGTNWIIL